MKLAHLSVALLDPDDQVRGVRPRHHLAFDSGWIGPKTEMAMTMNEQTGKVSAVFTPTAIAAISEGYAEACRIAKLHDDQDELRFRLADHVMLLARNGELDPRRLSTEALAAVMRETIAQQSDKVGLPAAIPGATGVGAFAKVP